MEKWKGLPDDSRIWIYQSDRMIIPDEIELINEMSQQFVDRWSSHGQNMSAAHVLLHSRFLVFIADEKQAQASGCSIDSSVHFVQSLEEEFDIDFFNRMRVLYKSGRGISHVDMPDIPDYIQAGKLIPDTIVFDTLITSKGELLTSFEKPLSATWLIRYITD